MSRLEKKIAAGISGITLIVVSIYFWFAMMMACVPGSVR